MNINSEHECFHRPDIGRLRESLRAVVFFLAVSILTNLTEHAGSRMAGTANDDGVVFQSQVDITGE